MILRDFPTCDTWDDIRYKVGWCNECEQKSKTKVKFEPRELQMQGSDTATEDARQQVRVSSYCCWIQTTIDGAVDTYHGGFSGSFGGVRLSVVGGAAAVPP